MMPLEAPNTRFEPRCDTSRVVGKQEVSRVADQEKSNFGIGGHSPETRTVRGFSVWIGQ
jgi:hypothetical protein